MEQFEENKINDTAEIPAETPEVTEEASSAEPVKENARYAPPPYSQNPLNYHNNDYYGYNGEVIEGKKTLSAGIIAGFVVLLVIIIVLTAVCVSMITRPASEDGNNLIGEVATTAVPEEPAETKAPDESAPLITMPKPDIEEKYMEADGRYTPQGIAKVVSPSVVGVVVYGEGQRFMPTSQGSGIVLSEDGYILTNAHVVDGATAQKIILSDGTEYEVEIVGSDTKTDLAVLKADGVSGLIPAQLGDSSQLELGEQVMAIGNSNGLSGSITGGFVSGMNRKVQTDFSGNSMECIQTDAAINPGNSGGALVNMYGQVVGIVTSKYMNVDIEGIGFAIPINTAVPIVKDLMEQGYVQGRVRIGITYGSITPYSAEINGVKPGMYITAIDPSCDIANTKLREGDIITEIEGISTVDSEDIDKVLAGKKAGDTLTARVYRKSIINGKSEEFTISFKLMEDTNGQ